MWRHPYLRALPAAAAIFTTAVTVTAGPASGVTVTAGPASGTAAAGPTSVTISPTSRAPVSAQDRAWLGEAHQANLAEIEVGDLAGKKGTTSEVRTAGRMLVTDHTAFDGKVTHLAGRLGVSLPKTPTPADATVATRLRNESGKTFDQDFLSTMVSGHQKVIADTRTQVSQGSSARVIALAKQALPELRKHLAMLKKAQTSG
jgi:putative membrane protein